MDKDEIVKVVYTCGGKGSYEKFLSGESVLMGIYGRGNRHCDDCTEEKIPKPSRPPKQMTREEFENNGRIEEKCIHFGKVVYEGEIVS